MIGIYKIQSIIKPERCYIGSSTDITKRWNWHINDLKLNKHHSYKLQNHYNKYGLLDLTFSILVECLEEDLIKIEQTFIDSTNSYFNICKVADRPTGVKRTKEARIKRSINSIGQKNNFYGKKHTNESNQQRREWNLLHGVKPPTYHKGRKPGTRNKIK